MEFLHVMESCLIMSLKEEERMYSVKSDLGQESVFEGGPAESQGIQADR